jgi:hypothetical protein
MAKKKPKPDGAAKAKKKAEAAAVALRVEEILRIRLDGAQYHDVLQYSAEKGWNLKERQLREYMRRADTLLVERQDKNRKQVIARHLAQRTALYARAVNAADYRTALAILSDDAKLRGLYPEKEIKELVKLAAAQGQRIEELERRLHDAHTVGEGQAATAPELATAGPTPDPNAGGSGGTAGAVPCRPGPVDG